MTGVGSYAHFSGEHGFAEETALSFHAPAGGACILKHEAGSFSNMTFLYFPHHSSNKTGLFGAWVYIMPFCAQHGAQHGGQRSVSMVPSWSGYAGNTGDGEAQRECFVKKTLPNELLPANHLSGTSAARRGRAALGAEERGTQGP